ncbi:ribbon-helix-helix domain-containing protein [Flexivirga lutea]
MVDILIRNVDDDDLKAIDAMAASRGISRSELLRREAHEFARRHNGESVTVDDLRRSLALTTDLLDDDVMRGAWE